MIIRLLSEFFNKDKTLIDFGSAYGKNSCLLHHILRKVILIDPFISKENLIKINKRSNVELKKIKVSNFKDIANLINKRFSSTSYLFF